MKKFLLILLMIPLNLNAGTIDLIDKEVKKLIADFHIPALSIAIIDNDKTLYKRNYGYVSLYSKQKINDKSIWQIASISKTFIAATIAILNDRKLLSWNDKIINHIDYFELSNSDFLNKITIGDIASMQSGLPSGAGKEYLSSVKNSYELIKYFALVDSIHSPGSRYFSYQYGLLSVIEQIITKVTKMNWEKFIKIEIFDKLNLKNTGINIHNLINKRNVVQPVSNLNHQADWENFKVNSAAGFYSSLADMIKWLQFNMNKGIIGKKRLISLSQINKIHQKNTRIHNNETYLYLDKNIKEINYGYFWKSLLYQISNVKTMVYEHNGNCNGMSSIISYLPEQNIGIIILSNKQTLVPEIIRSKILEIINKENEK